MNWDALGAVGEVVGALGVILTLIYLAAQIRQNTNQLQGEAITAINEAEVALIREFRDDPTLIAAYVKCTNDWEAGSVEEQARTHLHLFAYVRNCETAYNLWKAGALAERIYLNREALIESLLTPSGGRVWWGFWSGIFEPEFADRITNRIDSDKGRPNEIMTFDEESCFSVARWAERENA